MADYVVLLTLVLRLANLAVAGYLLGVVFPLYWKNRNGSFSKALKIVMVAVLLFFAVEFAQVFRLIGAEVFSLLQSLFSFVFLLLLILAVLEIRQGMLAHDHLMRRKQRARLSDVE